MSGNPDGGGGGGIRRLWKMKNVEQTKMNPDFVKSVKHIDDYKEAVDVLVDRLELAVQQNPTVLATVSKIFRNVLCYNRRLFFLLCFQIII